MTAGQAMFHPWLSEGLKRDGSGDLEKGKQNLELFVRNKSAIPRNALLDPKPRGKPDTPHGHAAAAAAPLAKASSLFLSPPPSLSLS